MTTFTVTSDSMSKHESNYISESIYNLLKDLGVDPETYTWSIEVVVDLSNEIEEVV